MLQASSGQRVNTDSCVFADQIVPPCNPSRILDIGTGSGVVAMMLGIRFPESTIEAIEPIQEIFEVAAINFASQKIFKNINPQQKKVQEMSQKSHGQFDLVVCNPPYFQNSTESSDPLRHIARHTLALGPSDLFSGFADLTTDSGSAWMSCPTNDLDDWLRAGKAVSLLPYSLTHLHSHPGAKPHVTIIGWSKTDTNPLNEKDIFYRHSKGGSQSEWMTGFRARWYPSRYFKSN
ncbi:MAG: methyltransferase [Proteobacteria bacterium]|nr:methyltransferase [Pseudomonadota bacterium]